MNINRSVFTLVSVITWVTSGTSSLAITFPPTATEPTGALRFSGSGQYVAVTESAAFDLTSSLTIETWVKVAAFDTTDQAFLAKGDAWGLYRNGSSRRISFRTKSGTTVHNLPSTFDLVTGRWYHIAAVYDGSTKFLYIDGELNTSAPYTGTINISSLPLWLGGSAAASNKLFNGTLDEVRVWSVPRSLTEIRTDIDRQLRPEAVGIRGEWRFDESSGLTALDSSLALRHGTLVDMTDGARVLGILHRPAPPVAEVSKNALRFDGDDRQFVVTPGMLEPDFDLTTLTLEAWINIGAFDQPWQAIVTKGEGWGLTRYGDTRKLAFRTFDGTSVHDLASNAELLLNRWYHVAAVYNGAEKRLYLDGVLDASVSYSGALAANDANVVVAGNAEVRGRAFHGVIDSVRVWSTERESTAIKADMLRELRGSEEGLMADWRFNELAGTVALDTSYGDRHAVLVNMAEANRVPGLLFSRATPPDSTVPQSALQFTGSTESAAPRVVITEESAFDVNVALTIEAWVNVTAFEEAWESIVTKGDAWGITRFDQTDRIAFRTDQGFASADLAGATELLPGRWYHVAAVFDGREKRLYIDGRLDGSAPFSGPLQANDQPLVIGGNAEQLQRNLHGRMENVRVWSVARSGEDVAAHRDREMRGSEVGLLGEWRFDEAAGTEALDSSARGFDGTLTDMNPGTDRVEGLPLRGPADGELALSFVQSGSQVQYVELPSEAAFDFTDELTLEAWLYFDNLPLGPVALISKGEGAWQLLLRPSGKLQFITPGILGADGTPATDLLSASTLDIRQWNHVAVTLNVSAPLPATGGSKTIYVNGRIDEQQSNLHGGLTQNALPVLMAARPTSGGGAEQAFGGVLDEVRIWRVARRGERILETYTRRLNGREPLLAGVWSFNEGSGPQALDTKDGVGFHGTLQGAMTTHNRVDGQALEPPQTPQSALIFDGTQYIEIPHGSALNLAGQATLEALIKPLGNGWRTILFKGADGYGLVLDPDNYLRYFRDELPQNALSSSRKVENGRWQHVAVVVDTSAGTTAFYINGDLSGRYQSAAINNNAEPLFLGCQHLLAGGDAQNNINYYVGELDEVRVWNVARSSLEIEFLASRPLPFGTPGLAGYWSFDAGGGSVLADGSPNRLDGLLVGMDDTNWTEGQAWALPPLEQNVNLVLDPSTQGLWIGQVTIDKVNEVHAGAGAAVEEPTPTADPVGIRILLHVDTTGHARLLKDVVLMRTLPDPDDANAPRQVVLVTDPRLLGQFEGIVNRGGKLVGVRHGTAAYDFPGLELLLLGGVGPGVGCAGRIELPADFATNPFRHKYHPDHREGYAITREFTMQFDGDPGDSLSEAPGYGVHRLAGTYRETLFGLHRIPLKIEGRLTVERISSVGLLNDEAF